MSKYKKNRRTRQPVWCYLQSKVHRFKSTSSIVEQLEFSPPDMPASCLLTVLSPVSISGWSRYNDHETRLWLQMSLQVVLLIFSGLLFAFSCTKRNEILLSLAEVFVIIYQVSCLPLQAGSTNHLEGDISIPILRYMSALVSMAFTDSFYTLLQHNTYAYCTSIHM